MAGAIYLILEMNRPLEGAVQISPAPLQKALSVIGHAEGLNHTVVPGVQRTRAGFAPGDVLAGL